MMYRSQKGFSLIELLIAVAVLGVVSAFVFASYNAIVKNADLKTTSFKIIDTLQVARERTIASAGATRYGVHFEASQFVYFEGATYSATDPDNIVYAVPAGIDISDITLTGGGADVVFDRITGNTTQDGTIRVRITSTPLLSHTITILSSGRTDTAGETALPAGGTRLSDTRHVHFTYAQDVSGAVTLTLDFPGYSPTNIPFQSYVSGGVFDWSGSISVGGTEQVLRIHTHSLTPSAAEFSVTRDLRYNDKALSIYLDTNNIVNYSAAGVVTEGTSPFAYTPVPQ